MKNSDQPIRSRKSSVPKDQSDMTELMNFFVMKYFFFKFSPLPAWSRGLLLVASHMAIWCGVEAVQKRGVPIVDPTR